MTFFRLSILLFCLSAPALNAQEIDFGSYGEGRYTLLLTAGAGGPSTLDFGQVVRESGTHQIEQSNAAVVQIDGVEYLDVFVTITVQNEGQLLLNDVGNVDCIGDPACSISLELYASYSNNGEPHDPLDSIEIPIVANTGQVRFPIRRARNTAPGPPPPPPTDAFDQSEVEDSAALFFWGSINVGNVDAGPYYGEIEVVVSYELPQ